MNVLDNFKQAETFELMSMSDKLLATGYVILLGMGITFIALVLIWFITVIMSKTIQKLEKKNEPVSMISKEVEIKKLPTPALVASDDVDEELVAVITAAIAAAMNTNMHHIRVSNIKRIGDQTPTWGKIGRSDVMNARMN